MKITFLVCGVMNFPAGGYKVILEYANRLYEAGHEVHIALGAATISLKTTLAAFIRYPYYKITNNYSARNWFNVNCGISFSYNFLLTQNKVPVSDIYIATNVESSYYLERFKTSSKKFYFIQDYENWSVSKQKVEKSYKFKMEKIVISPWLGDILKKNGAKSHYLPNGFDFDYFKKDISIRNRDKYNILLMYHKMERKRCDDAIKALEIVKNKFPQLKIVIFGRPQKPNDLPFDCEYYSSPEKELHNKIYNEASIYIAASSIEGWGLTIGEAMICECAVACTDNDGFKIMAHHEETALLSPVYDYKKLAENIITLIEDDELRFRIAENAKNYIMKFTWENSFEKLKNILFNENV